MGMKYIDAKMLQKAFLAGAKGLEAKKEWINELNVFPVPDGDTGTNMTMTIMSAAKEVAAIENPTMETLAKAISSGSLRGARGNSGVILSQLFRGFTKEISGTEQVTTTVLANSFVRATETAYKAVMKPKEGTILTVAKGMADKAAELVTETEDVIEFCQKVIEHGDYVLSQTPEMLPVLKQAGVVDSGGQGLMQVVKGAFDCLMGKEVDLSVEGSSQLFQTRTETAHLGDIDIKFGYCTEFIVNLEKPYDEKTELQFKDYLESIGDSLVVVSDDDMVKVHVHTNDPGLAIQRALTYGSLSRMKIDNMREEHQEKLIKESEKLAEQQKAEREKKAEPRKPYGFISVSAGEGLDEIFRGIGADYLIEGGQTMNPSTEDMLNAIDRVNADTVYILPNNKNIILAAEQAKGLVEDKKVVVIPSKTIPQGITAIINFAADLSPEDNERNMIEEMSRVKTGQITYAVRNTVIDDIEIQEGDIMALGDDGILAVGKDIESTVLHSLKSMVEEESELVTIYYGKDVNQDDANVLKEKAEEIFSACEVELHAGGQPIYYYLISVE
ncbi:phosphatase [Lacrimispora xylanolytica]|uniref:DAK2 domain-containing protein n=1 Tax=Lacrimispora xylanolytica TaxID=29375 RepID=A0ABY7A9G7_9FIRM|nr:DAK2 domain-containing protein [Lacrimispora xylanolytica]WAJ22167.1 DAK2 domain-containing protein [Lacrimispora xylanolytica]